MKAIVCGTNMLSASRICFSVAVFTVTLAASVVTGTVNITGARGPHAGQVVVWLDPVNREVPPFRPSSATMVQRQKQFRPHLLAVRTGTIVDFPNEDPIFHNAFSNIDGKQFDLGLYPPGLSRHVVFDRPGIVRVFCNIHQSMSAVIVVEDTPWMAVSDDRGNYRISGVPAGEYTLNVFFEGATSQTLNSLRRHVDIREQPTALAPIRISGAGYIPVPHRNKYGLEYPPEPADGSYGATP